MLESENNALASCGTLGAEVSAERFGFYSKRVMPSAA